MVEDWRRLFSVTTAQVHPLWIRVVPGITRLHKVRCMCTSSSSLTLTFLGGVAEAWEAGPCTQSSGGQGGAGGGEVAGVPEGVPFPPAQRQGQHIARLSQTSEKLSFP